MKYIRLCLVATAAMALVACGEQSPEQKAAMNEISFTRMAKEKIKERLKDPDSAIFSDVYFNRTQKDQIDVICGKVNSKNSFGGYSGDQHFMAFGTMQVLESDFKDNYEFIEAWNTYCQK